jgi:metallo-beta-lactamase family protein
MKIAFHGAARTVTGSKHLITLKNSKKILLDCGLFQGMGKDTDAYNREFGFDPSQVDVMILSHAHIDHSGLIPKLVKEGFKGSIHCTSATKELVKVLLEDSGEIQESDIKYSNKKRKAQGELLLQPLYTKADAFNSFEYFVENKYDEWFPVTDGVEALFTDAGHIIGSACVHVRITENGRQQQLTFSGDVGRYRDVILRSPATFSQAQFIVMESTYGNSLHEDIFSSIDHILQWIDKTLYSKKRKINCACF